MEEVVMAYVYILTNTHNTVLYVGATSDLTKRLYMHKKGLVRGFTKRYNIGKLVHYESFETMDQARKRETQLKKALRKNKIDLINTCNPAWTDLQPDWIDKPSG